MSEHFSFFRDGFSLNPDYYDVKKCFKINYLKSD